MFTKETREEMFNTVIANKGGSFYFDGSPVSVKSGYAVSLDGFETMTPVEGLSAIQFDNLLSDVVRKVDGLADPATHFVGAWIDGDNLYVDLSVHVQDKDTAIAKAKAGSQLAIWDFERNESVITATGDVL